MGAESSSGEKDLLSSLGAAVKACSSPELAPSFGVPLEVADSILKVYNFFERLERISS
jgi:hypothetical protein